VQVTQWKKDLLAHSAEVFEGDQKQSDGLERLKKERDELFRQIGELKFANDWYKKNYTDAGRTKTKYNRPKRSNDYSADSAPPFRRKRRQLIQEDLQYHINPFCSDFFFCRV